MVEKTILLVEDNADDVILTERALRKSHIVNELVVAHDGVEALDYFFCRNSYADRNIQDLPEVVLLDLKLPRIGGLEVLKQIRANPLTCLQPVVVLTSSLEDQDITESYRLGANSYIRKPVDFNQFVDAVQKLGLYWLTLNHGPRLN
jgi:CheY-like chemotaxis protein